MNEWGWLSYKRTNWIRDDGRKMYIGHFRLAGDPNNWTRQTVRFWAKRPVLALRAICRSGQDPKRFHGKEVN